MAKRQKITGVLVSPAKRVQGPRFGRRRKVRSLNIRTAGFLGIERKFANFEAQADAFTTSWATMQDATIKSVSAVAIGNTESTRVGRVYHITSIHLRGTCESGVVEADGAPTQTQVCRFVLVHDTQTNGAELTATDVMDASGTDDFIAFRNLQFTKRFRILMDKTIAVRPIALNEGASNLFASAVTRVPWKFNRTFKKPIKVTCKGTTAVIASVTDNSIHMIGIANNVFTTPTLTYQCRVRFTG